MKNYYKLLFKMLLRDPLKLKAMVRLRTGGEHRRKKYYRREDGFSGPPITVAIRLSYRCNLRCIQCGQWGEHGIFRELDPQDLAKEELTTEEVKKFIKEISVFKPYIYFTGGEPLLREDLFELIRFCSSLHLITSISSNCTLLPNKAERLVESGIDYFYASLDAPDYSNNCIRRGLESFERAVEGIKYLNYVRNKKAGLPIIQVQTIILKENQDKLFQMAKFVEKLNVDVWGLQLCVFATEDSNKKTEEIYLKEFGIKSVYWRGFVMNFSSGLDFKLLEEELKKILACKWKFKLRIYRPLNFSNFSFKTYFERPDILLVEPPCMYPWTFAQLQPNGDIAFCGSQPDYIIGNIRKEDFIKIWNNERAINFRKFIKKNLFPVCSRCFGLYIFSTYK